VSESDDSNAEHSNDSTSDSPTDETTLFTRRAALKLGVFSMVAGVGSTETIDPVSADSDGYGMGGYGEGPYGG
jgi:hypothetical protein